MFSPRLLALSLAAAVLPGNGADDLQVLRHLPEDDASPTAVILITFDRPVAEDLDRGVSAASILSIEPAIPGKADWRDPVTLRFTPSELLPVGGRYTVSVSNDFTASDGSRLPEPFRFSFRVRGPSVLTNSIATMGNAAQYVDTRPRIALLLSGPGDFELLTRAAWIELAPQCGGERVVRLTLAGDRPITERDPWQYRRWTRDDDTGERGDQVRLVEFTPARELPRDCAAVLTVPQRADTEIPGEPQRWAFHTYGPLRLADARCGNERWCATGPLRLRFTTPVKGAALAAALRLTPPAPVLWTDTTDERTDWWLSGELKPRTTYIVVLDSALRDVFGQRLGPAVGKVVRTTGYAPYVQYPMGRLLVERTAYRTLALTYMNARTVVAATTPILDSLLPELLSRPWGHAELLAQLAGTRFDTLPVLHQDDRSGIALVRIPVWNAQRPGSPALVAVQADTSPKTVRRAPVALVQVTDLAVHARLGLADGAVWVVGASDGKPREGVDVTLYDGRGHARLHGTTDAQGMVRFPTLPPAVPDTAGTEADWYRSGFDGYVTAVLGNDRAIVSLSQSDWELNPWRFAVRGAWSGERAPVAAAVFTDRGIYRPTETVHAKLIVRRGLLGALTPPPPGDSARIKFTDREGETVRDTVVRLSAFGTADETFAVPDGAALGSYAVSVATVTDGQWSWIGNAAYRVAEYRPPEFLADVRAADTVRMAGDSLTVTIDGRYLFGAPMAGAAVQWALTRQSVSPWELRIPGTERFSLTEARWWWEEASSFPGVVAQGTDSLDADGALRLTQALPAAEGGQPYRATVTATIADVNRQTASASAGALVHPAAFYLGVRAAGDEYFWRAGQPQDVEAIAVRPDGEHVAGVAVTGVLVRREWHRVRRERGGYTETVGEWVSDTVGTCAVTTTVGEPARCRVNPTAAGQYTLRFTAVDPAGHAVAAGMYRWVTGPDWVPWFDESQLKMDVVPDRDRYAVGDTAIVLLASPFTDVEAWVTVEREGIIEQRRLRITAGTTTLTFPITEAYAPNVFVSVLVSKGRTAPPGTRDDPGRPAIRVGYAELRVTPEVKRLNVAVTPLATEYRPGDTARVRLAVTDAAGRGRRSEVTLWAVDEGVLALTGYQTPDPIDLLYRPRGVGLRLGSNLVAVAPQVADSGQALLEKGAAPGGGGGLDVAGILRSRFASTAFFLGSVVTDDQGQAVAEAKLPDNLTTFRVMAVALTAGDRYGHGESPLLVTRPLLARPALPRFVREGDRFEAGAVINHRLGRSADVTVEAEARGIALDGARRTRVQLAGGRAQEVRFPFTGEDGDTAVFRFKVSSGTEADAVEARIPIQPAFHVRSHTIAGVLHDRDSVTFALPADIDPGRSRLSVRLGVSPLSVIRAMAARMRVYPYYCSEQITSVALPLIALLDAARTLGDSTVAPRTAHGDLEQAVRVLTRRQRADGGIGYWGADEWTSPWLTAYAGIVLLGARDLGIAVSDSVLPAIATYLTRALRRPEVQFAWLGPYFRREQIALGEQLAALDFLARYGAFDAAAANRLREMAPKLGLADRARLADVLTRAGRPDDARQILARIWSATTVEGRRAVLPRDTAWTFYFWSRTRVPAAVLAATVRLQPDHPLVGPLVETLLGAVRAEPWWSTQDVGAAVPALAELERAWRAAGDRGLRVRVGGRTLALPGDSSIALSGLLTSRGEEPRGLAVLLEAQREGPAVFYDVTVQEVPSRQPVRPDDAGIRVERWYEPLQGGDPVMSVAAGEIVRVKLRVTVPTERQFVVLDDPLPGGLEAVDVSLRTQGELPGVQADRTGRERTEPQAHDFGIWWGDWWSPFDHREMRDDRVVFAATRLPPGTYYATYVARATTPGTFVRPPAFAEEMYNPAVQGRTDGGRFTVTAPGR
jgi:uncharacterized protein YfaS (alpha-2-macroglobulin family)